jgi:hypothetical protein
MKRSKLWLRLTLIGSGLLLSVVERNYRRRRKASISQNRSMVDDEPRRSNQNNSEDATKNSPIPLVERPASNREQHSSTYDEEANRHLRIRTIAKRRQRIRREGVVTFWVELTASLTTVTIAGLTFVYVHYSGRQWQAAQEANRIARIANGITQENVANADRPWVGLSAAALTNFNVGQQPTLSLTFLNSGKTPALNFYSTVDLRLVLGSPPSRTPPTGSLTWPIMEPTTTASRSAVFPNTTIGSTNISGWALDNVQFENIKSGHTWLVFKARLRYEDTNKRAHETDVCAFYDPSINVFHTCAQGNSAS